MATFHNPLLRERAERFPDRPDGNLENPGQLVFGLETLPGLELGMDKLTDLVGYPTVKRLTINRFQIHNVLTGL